MGPRRIRKAGVSPASRRLVIFISDPVVSTCRFTQRRARLGTEVVRVRTAAGRNIAVFEVCDGASEVRVVCPVNDHIIGLVVAVAIVVYAALESVAAKPTWSGIRRVPRQSEVQGGRVRIATEICGRASKFMGGLIVWPEAVSASNKAPANTATIPKNTMGRILDSTFENLIMDEGTG